MFKSVELLEDILAREDTINFEGNEEIRHQVHKLVKSLVQNKLLT
ncbi:MAG: hypothetical protein WCG25_02625 [bacterium]